MNDYNYSFFKFMHDLVDSGTWAKLSVTAKTLYPVLCRFTNESFKPVWPGTEELLKLTGLKSKKSLQQAKKELIQAGLVDIISGTGRTSSRYYFKFDYPGSRINIEHYREKFISPRERDLYPPGEDKSRREGMSNSPPNNINININTNNNKQEERLSNLELLLKNFQINDVSKNNFIETLLQKYGPLETGEAIKIAISKGKNGDLKYLEGILKNREKAPKNNQHDNLYRHEVENIFDKKYHIYFNSIKQHYKYNNTVYFLKYNDIPEKELKQNAEANGYNIYFINVEKDEIYWNHKKKTLL